MVSHGSKHGRQGSWLKLAPGLCFSAVSSHGALGQTCGWGSKTLAMQHVLRPFEVCTGPASGNQLTFSEVPDSVGLSQPPWTLVQKKAPSIFYCSAAGPFLNTKTAIM